jgi:nucleotide sugar dehydrogenase
MNIGIIGNGYVGKATKLLGCKDEANDLDDNLVLVYDIDESKRVPSDLKMSDLQMCDVVFVCVPTPALPDGTCDTRAVETVVGDLKDLDITSIVIRSTVPVGTCERLGVAFMPEFLTEKKWENDVRNTKEWIIGCDHKDDKLFKAVMKRIFITAKRNNRISGANFVWASTKEAEAAKLVRNAFLATKVSFCNEIYDWCSELDINYDAVGQLMGMDKRIGESHTSVPGPDGKKGYGGTCFPKDMNSLLNQIKSVSTSHIINAAVYRNEIVDRPEKDWKEDKGRAVS